MNHKSIYKYVVPERVDVLEEALIRFTQPAELNDLFEFRPNIGEVKLADISSENEVDKIIDINLKKKYQRLPEETRKRISYGELVSAYNKEFRSRISSRLEEVLGILIPDVFAVVMEKVSQSVGVLSMTSDPVSPVMWAHYADQNRGFVFEFDAGHSFFNSKGKRGGQLDYIRPVKYLPPNQKVPYKDEDTCFTKIDCWSYEKEWRMMKSLNDAAVVSLDRRFHLFSIPMPAIRRVILGHSISENVKRNIEAILKSKKEVSHIGLAQIKLREKSRELVIENHVWQ